MNNLITNKATNFYTSLLLVSFAYFIFHFFNGNHGLISLIDTKKEINKSEKKLDKIVSKKLTLQHKVSLLKQDSLDLDTLDEQARKILGYSSKSEKVFLRQ